MASLPTSSQIVQYLFGPYGKPFVNYVLSYSQDPFLWQTSAYGAPFVGSPSGVYLSTDTEEINVSDSLEVSVAQFQEDITSEDQLIAVITLVLQEDITASDNIPEPLVAYGDNQAVLNVEDSAAEQIVLSFEEDQTILDQDMSQTVIPFEDDITSQDSENVLLDITFEDTTRVVIASLTTYEDSVQVNVLQTSLAPITDYTSASNPMSPTIIVNGSYIQQNEATDPGVTAARTAISMLNTGILNGSSICNIINFNMNLDLSIQGGRWSVVTANNPGFTLGETITFFGLQATVQEVGEGTNRQYGQYYTFAGTFTQNWKLDMPIMSLANSSPVIKQLFPSNSLAPPPSSAWQTLSSAARAISTAVGLTVVWGIPDHTLTDATQFAGATVGSALSTIAEMAGGILMWDGYNTYLVGFPDQSRGSWSVPSCSLITAPGIYTNNLYTIRPWQGLMLGNSGQPQMVYGGTAEFVPLYSLFQPDPTIYPNTPKVEFDGSVTKLLAATEYRDIQLKPGYDVIQVQVIPTGATPDTSGVYVTTDVDTWFPYGGAVITKQDGTQWARVTLGDMPSDNTDVQNNNFHMNIGHTRDLSALKATFNNNANQNRAKNASILASNLSNYKFVQSSNGYINCVFFGSIPLPGMECSATLDGQTVSGIAQSVSVSMPGVINVTLGSFVRYSYYIPSQSSNTTNANAGEGSQTGGYIRAL